MVFLALYLPFTNTYHKTRFDNYEPIKMRAEFSNQLGAVPGEHLVIVRYAPEHPVWYEWVYNGADIDSSKIGLGARDSRRQPAAPARLLPRAPGLAG